MNIYDVALRRLEHRSRTCYEMRKYLSDKDFSETEINELIDEFTDAGYLNDFNYCQEYFRYAFGKGKGKLRVFTELKQKGVDPLLVSDAFEKWDEEVDEKAIAMDEAKKILRAADVEAGAEISEKVIARIGRRLSSKGFSAGLIYSVIGDLRDE